MSLPDEARSSHVEGLYRRVLGTMHKVVALVRKKGLRNIVVRRILNPLRAVRSGDTSVPFARFQAEPVGAKQRIRIAILADPKLELCLGFEADLLSLKTNPKREAIEAFEPAFALVATLGLGPPDGGESALLERLSWCRDLGVPTVLWVDDEAPAVEHALSAAFDLIVVTRPELVPRFPSELAPDRIRVLPLAIQPAIHNPMNRAVPQRRVCWLGSLAEVDRLPEGDGFRTLVRVAVAQGLDVFEVTAHGSSAGAAKVSSAASNGWRGSLDYERVLTAYRTYQVFLEHDLASGPAAQRALELAACGTHIISDWSSPRSELPRDSFTLVRDEAQAESALEQLLADEAGRAARGHRSYREAMHRHTYAERLLTLRQQLGEAVEVPEPPLVSILAASNRPGHIDNILENFDRQAHPRCELILLLNSDAYDLERVQDRVGSRSAVQVHRLDEALTLADCLNHGVKNASGSWIAKFDDDDFYGKEYLADLLSCTLFTDAEVLGKRAYHVYFEASDRTALRFASRCHRHVDFVHGGTLMIRRRVFDELSFTPVPRGTDTVFQRACRARGLRIYSSDPYNFVHVRHSPGASHTWTISDEELLQKCSWVRSGLPLEEIMI